MENEEISFGRFRLHPGRRELLRDEVPVRLHRRAVDILCALAAAKGAIVGKDELLAVLWPGRIVEEGNLHVHVSGLRRALDEHGEGHSYIVTVPGRGYRLAVSTDAPSARFAEAPASRYLPLPDKPSIAVMPFANLSGDPDQEYFADDMVEEIITVLSRIRWLFVIARNSTSTYKGQPFDVKRVGRELGVRYVLEGSVRKAAGRVRITAQLIEAETGAHLWADRFDGSLEDVFELQDRVATSIAGVIEPTLHAAEQYRSTQKPTHDSTAYDLYLRAVPIFFGLRKKDILAALDLFEQAIARDPNYAIALSWAAICHMRLCVDDLSEDPETCRQQALGTARRALQTASDDPSVLAHTAYVFGFLGEEISAAIALADRALLLHPNYARGWFLSGAVRVFAGHCDVAIDHLQTSLRLSPRIRMGAHSLHIGAANFFMRRFDKAAAELLLATQEYSTSPWPSRIQASCLANMGLLAEARPVIERIRAMTPVVIPATAPYRNPEHRDLFFSGLRLAMDEAQ